MEQLFQANQPPKAGSRFKRAKSCQNAQAHRNKVVVKMLKHTNSRLIGSMWSSNQVIQWCDNDCRIQIVLKLCLCRNNLRQNVFQQIFSFYLVFFHLVWKRNTLRVSIWLPNLFVLFSEFRTCMLSCKTWAWHRLSKAFLHPREAFGEKYFRL